MKSLICIILTSLLLSTSVRAAADFVSFAKGTDMISNSSRANRGKPRQQPLQLFWCKQVSFAPKLNFGKKWRRIAYNSV